MTYCSHCGRPVDGDARVCPHCGGALTPEPLVAPPDAAGAAPFHPCPNCRNLVEVGRRLCPHCGAEQAPLPVLQGEPQPELKPMSGHIWLDVMLGVFTVIGSCLGYGIGVVIPLVLYFVLRPKHPYFARGLGWGLLGVGAILLGVLAICLASVMQPGFR